jgi:hypothetical protein
VTQQGCSPPAVMLEHGVRADVRRMSTNRKEKRWNLAYCSPARCDGHGTRSRGGRRREVTSTRLVNEDGFRVWGGFAKEEGASYVVADAPRRWHSVSRGRCSWTARGAGRCSRTARPAAAVRAARGAARVVHGHHTSGGEELAARMCSGARALRSLARWRRAQRQAWRGVVGSRQRRGRAEGAPGDGAWSGGGRRWRCPGGEEPRAVADGKWRIEERRCSFIRTELGFHGVSSIIGVCARRGTRGMDPR